MAQDGNLGLFIYLRWPEQELCIVCTLNLKKNIHFHYLLYVLQFIDVGIDCPQFSVFSNWGNHWGCSEISLL